MGRLTERWFGIILKVVREYYPDARLVAWGPLIDEGTSAEEPARYAHRRANSDARLEIVILDPSDPEQSHLVEIRRALAVSELPMESDVRLMSDLTTSEREEVLQRGIQFGG